MGDPYFIKLTMVNGAPTWINLANVAFIYQQPGAQTVVRFSGPPDNQVGVKESLADVAELLPPFA
ncbi:MAG TPA: hypothetical protein VFC51_01575 [Chloroflexota bacterium]|nr:hypothetical protein [Chloroflexota bacterium]